MVEISDCDEKCFAIWAGNCSILTSMVGKDCTPKCPFYKPKGCEDWIRREKDGEIWLIPPEEYAKPAEWQGWNGK